MVRATHADLEGQQQCRNDDDEGNELRDLDFAHGDRLPRHGCVDTCRVAEGKRLLLGKAIGRLPYSVST